MRQFLNNDDQAFRDLEQRALSGCVVFADQEMPPGTSPNKLRVGFEGDPANGSVSLLVDASAAYVGANAEVREWLGLGQKRFASFADLRNWLGGVLKPAFLQNDLEPSVATIDDLFDRSRIAELGGGAEIVPKIDAGQLADQLALQIRGQDNSLRRLSKKVAQQLARRSPRRPATIFALGPTGVGKTQSAECLPGALRKLDGGHEDIHYLRLDMSEYSEKHRVSQLLGSPQGYIGYGDGSQLTDALAEHPRSIILFDEIEKAHPDILQTLMNAMDAGRLSSASSTRSGREIDCRHSVFFFTSNIEADGILSEIGDRRAFGNALLIDDICRKHLKKSGLKSELIGRIGCFLVFRPLSDETRAEIMALSVVRVAREYGVTASRIEPETLVSLLKKTNRREFGARPDEYLIDEILGTTFARGAELHGSAPVEIVGTSDYRCIPIGN